VLSLGSFAVLRLPGFAGVSMRSILPVVSLRGCWQLSPRIILRPECRVVSEEIRVMDGCRCGLFRSYRICGQQGLPGSEWR
jgi:hypothetical protein